MDVIHHLAIPTHDVAESVRWYLANTDCSVDYQDATWALLGFANIKLALVLPGQHPPHFAIVRADAERYGPLKRHRDGTRSIYIADAAGNQIEVMEAASLKPAPAQTPVDQ